MKDGDEQKMSFWPWTLLACKIIPGNLLPTPFVPFVKAKMVGLPKKGASYFNGMGGAPTCIYGGGRCWDLMVQRQADLAQGGHLWNDTERT
jgi:hypothetical protein